MSLGETLQQHLPFLRRYSRALNGNQRVGDDYVRATLEAIVAAPDEFPRHVEPRVALYATHQKLWAASFLREHDRTAGDTDPEATGIEHGGDRLTEHLRRLTPLSRQCLLLTTMEGFGATDAAYILGIDSSSVERHADDAMQELQRQARVEVMIIEDEPIIALDIETIVRDLGHEVTGIAVTREEAVALAVERRPGLILADIQLADDSSGIEAVAEILQQFQVPVIFITAFPERLLTGQRPEPAFLITKPFQRSTVKAAISQALFVGSDQVPA